MHLLGKRWWLCSGNPAASGVRILASPRSSQYISPHPVGKFGIRNNFHIFTKSNASRNSEPGKRICRREFLFGTLSGQTILIPQHRKSETPKSPRGTFTLVATGHDVAMPFARISCTHTWSLQKPLEMRSFLPKRQGSLLGRAAPTTSGATWLRLGMIVLARRRKTENGLGNGAS